MLPPSKDIDIASLIQGPDDELHRVTMTIAVQEYGTHARFGFLPPTPRTKPHAVHASSYFALTMNSDAFPRPVPVGVDVELPDVKPGRTLRIPYPGRLKAILWGADPFFAETDDEEMSREVIQVYSWANTRVLVYGGIVLNGGDNVMPGLGLLPAGVGGSLLDESFIENAQGITEAFTASLPLFLPETDHEVGFRSIPHDWGTLKRIPSLLSYIDLTFVFQRAGI